MAGFGSTISLATLDGLTGFRIDGAGIDDWMGGVVAGAGDLNGDGFADLVIGRASDGAGAVHVLFGSDAGFAPIVSLSALDGSAGFTLLGAVAGDEAGFSVAGAGDVNGDGIADLILGARAAGGSGAAWVVYGSDQGFAATSGLGTLPAAAGFGILGAAAGDNAGHSVAAAGDVNGDGIADFLVGAVGADPGGSGSGAAWVVFGQTGGPADDIDLALLDGSDGFRIAGAATGDQAGSSVAAAGDVNGDGFGDVIVGGWFADASGVNSGAAWVVFGASGFGASIDLVGLDGSTGFRLRGPAANSYAGVSVASVGDINGDGLDDLVIGANAASLSAAWSGAAYVVFGSSAGFAADIDLAALDGSDGFSIAGPAAYASAGQSVSRAGDVNGDGIGDLIVGAPGAGGSGAAFVVFGHSGAWGAAFDLTALDGSNGFRIDGAGTNSFAGTCVAAAGDINGDGCDDLIVGAEGTSTNGTNSGAVYVVYGRPADRLIEGDPGDQTLTGGAGDDTILGGGGIDLLSGQEGHDLLDLSLSALGTALGGAGNDRILSGLAAGSIDGGAGEDMIEVAPGGADLSGVALAGIEWLLTGGQTVTATAAQFLSFAHVARGRDPVSLPLAVSLQLAGGGTVDLAGALAGRAVDLTVTGAGATVTAGQGDDTLTGGSGADRLIGGAGNDTLAGGAADRLIGGDGNDTYLLASPDAAVVEPATGGTDTLIAGFSLVLAAGLENLVLIGADDLSASGNRFANHITGNSGANGIDSGQGEDSFAGLGGDDSLNAGGGADSLEGGAGNDLLIGMAGNDTLAGGDGNDTLNGGRGGDVMEGGAGDDTYYRDNPLDLVIEAADGGRDRLLSSVAASLADISSEVEDLTLTGTANLRGDGNALDNLITGNDGDNVLNGDAGNDTLNGGLGQDRLNGGAGNDSLLGGSGNDGLEGAAGDDIVNGGAGDDSLGGGLGRDILSGGDGDDLLDGGAGADDLNGGAGNDVLTGGAGVDRLAGSSGDDVMTGGADGDVFVFTGAFGSDRIEDISSAAASEVIDLTRVAAISDFADLLANHLTETPLGAVITAGANAITLAGVQVASLTADDFLF